MAPTTASLRGYLTSKFTLIVAVGSIAFLLMVALAVFLIVRKVRDTHALAARSFRDRALMDTYQDDGDDAAAYRDRDDGAPRDTRSEQLF